MSITFSMVPAACHKCGVNITARWTAMADGSTYLDVRQHCGCLIAIDVVRDGAGKLEVRSQGKEGER